MNEEFLMSLGLDGEVSEQILTKLSAERLEGALEKELENAGVCDKTAADVLLERDGLSEDNLCERVDALKRAHPTLFKAEAPKIVSAAESRNAVEKGEFERMGYKERLELYKKSPDTYRKLINL